MGLQGKTTTRPVRARASGPRHRRVPRLRVDPAAPPRRVRRPRRLRGATAAGLTAARRLRDTVARHALVSEKMGLMSFGPYLADAAERRGAS